LIENSQLAMVWIAWETHTRNRTLSKEFGATLVQLDYATSHWLARYLRSIFTTIILLWQWRGKIVFAQNPSIILCFLCVVLRPILRYQLVVDAHNAGVYPQEGKTFFLQKLADFIIRNTPFTIVTNSGIASAVALKGGHPLVVPDPLPPAHGFSNKPIHRSVLFVCSWAADEPYLEVFKAAQALPDVSFYVTGNSRGREGVFGSALPSNVELTGFLAETDYFNLLASCSLVLDLTTREHCLVCGAYEAVSHGKPFVLSNNEATMDYFATGGRYCDNSASSIAECVQEILNNEQRYIDDVQLLRATLCVNWPKRLEEVQAMIKTQG
jgi:glycosyltransferase involved in cell wall biosynthesis